MKLYIWGGRNRKETLRKILLLGIGGNNEEMPRRIFLLGNRHHSKEWSSFISQDPDEINNDNRSGEIQLFRGIIWTLSGNRSELEEKYNSLIAAQLPEFNEKLPYKANRAVETQFLSETIDKLPPDERLLFGYTFLYYLQALTSKDWKQHSTSKNRTVYASTMALKDISIPVYLLPYHFW